MVQEVHVKNVFELSKVFYNAWTDDTPIKICLFKSEKNTLDELFEEAEEKEIDTDHIDWEIIDK